ncbi:AGC/Akt protein kinase [Meredithblackwellia eburnea MCA 4105]
MGDRAREASSSSTISGTLTTGGVLLSIRLIEAKGLVVPQGVDVAADRMAAGVSNGAKKRESVQRKECSFLPYCILTFDKNEVVIDPLGGSLTSPSYLYSTSFDVSREADISISAYLRVNPSSASAGPGQGPLLGQPTTATGDVFLASTTLQPNFDPRKTSDRWYQAIAGGGEFRLQVAYQPTKHESLTIDSFELLKVVGKGSFGKVMQVRKKDTGRIYALKTIRKAHIVSRSEVTHTLAERTVLANVTSPFIVPLKFSFQSPEKLYLVLAYVNGGELFHHLQNEGRFNEERSRFYAAELLCALDHLHQFNVVYRDLKPENILIDYTGHLTLCDFGLCKLNMTENERTNTFAGTPEYLSPELILGEGYTRVVDWWTLGVLLYEMLSGLPPFYEEDHQKMYRRIVGEELTFPPGLVGEARRILTGLLQKNPANRLGARGAEEIRRHLFFHGLDWDALATRRIQPPFRPSVESAVDTSNVDSEFLKEAALDSVVEDSKLSESTQAQFDGFTYVAPTGPLGESVR